MHHFHEISLRSYAKRIGDSYDEFRTCLSLENSRICCLRCVVTTMHDEADGPILNQHPKWSIPHPGFLSLV